ncbi:hypothetical protein NDU88_003627 [Pleurodeles waltl]|uniref:Uncharacterized protein n=1 Tax=Pleurodeles waltl TaxID=8319 RepID=A0AAV7NGX2_PLEWA|nr:hypothetical protein NDU88_003627 [Pleurodeles waltl]
MYKAPHFLESSAGSMPTEPSNLKSFLDRAVVAAEEADVGRDLVILVFPTQNKLSLQIDTATDDNGPLDISNLTGGLSMASLCFSAPSASSADQQVLPEGKTCQLPQGFSSLDNVKPAQNPEIEHQDLAVARLSMVGADLLTPVCTLRATRNSRQGKEDCHVVGGGGGNFYSLSDQSRDSDDASNSSSKGRETGNSSSPPTSTLRHTAIKCHERRGEGLNLGPKEKKTRKKKAQARAMSWDYTGIQQIPHRLDDLLVNPAGLEIDATKSEATLPSLGLIYQTIMAQHKQMQGDSKKARVATKQLHVAVSKIAKTCSEIGERIATTEARADVLETDLGAVAQQAAIHDTQLSDIQWKIEDFENRQRRNNLRSFIRSCVSGSATEVFVFSHVSGSLLNYV